MWNYESYKNWLLRRLCERRDELGFDGYSIEVWNEQDYAKRKSLKSKTITVIAKFLPSTLVFSVKTQPVQMLAITEENSISAANSILTSFVERTNFSVQAEGTTYVKHMYSTPSVLSNFNLIGIGMRTVLYVNATLFVLEDVMDITDLKVDGSAVDAISATIGYTMTGDTQPFGGGYAKTRKSFATFVLTLNVSCTKTGFTTKVAKIMNMSSEEKGDEAFSFSFKLGDIEFSGMEMRLVGATVATAINGVPSLQMSFSV